jgi:two-component system, cell cycle sensor histidine kinase and response regulator CckA
LDRVTVSEAVGCGFDSRLAHQFTTKHGKTGIFPNIMTTPTPQQKTAKQPAQKPSSSPNILLLDDDTELSALLKELLEMQCYRVTSVTSGVQGLREVMVADFDVILCDIVMPNLAGDMFYLAVERVKPHLCSRFIFITGHRNIPRTEAFLNKVGALVLWKPFDMQVMLEAVALAARNVAKGPSKPVEGTRLSTGEWVLDS